MNLKRVLGGILSIGGVIALIYAAMLAFNTGGGVRDMKSLAIFGILGLIFFFAGISLVRTTKDES